MTNEWHTMETAPRDGTEILAWHPRSKEMFVVFWNKDGWMICGNGMGGRTMLDADEAQWRELPAGPLDTETAAA